MKKLLFILFLPLFSYGQGHYPIAGALDTVDVPNIKATNKAYYQNIPTVLEPRDFVPYAFYDTIKSKYPYVLVEDFKTYSDTTWDKAFNDALTFANANGISTVYANDPTIIYWIDSAIKQPSNTKLIIHPQARIRLLDNSNCYMWTTRSFDTTNPTINIELSGGRWYGNGDNQTISTTSFANLDIDYYGLGFQLYYAKNFYIHDLEIDSTRLFAIGHLVCNGGEFRNIKIFQDITGVNRDGISGSSSNYSIYNLSGETGDDMVGIGNSQLSGATWTGYYPFPPIVENILVDGIFGQNVYQGVKVNPTSGRTIQNIIARRLNARFRFRPATIDATSGMGTGWAKNITYEDVGGYCWSNNNAINSQGVFLFRNANLENINIKGFRVVETVSDERPLVHIRNIPSWSNINISDGYYNTIYQNPLIKESGKNGSGSVNVVNVRLLDSTGFNKPVFYSKGVDTFAITDLNVSNIEMLDSIGIYQANQTNDKISLMGYSFRFDTASNYTNKNNVIFDRNIGFTWYFNGVWSRIPTSLDYIQNQSAATQTGDFKISGAATSGSSVIGRAIGLSVPFAWQRIISGVYTNRWIISMNNTAESGSNAGSNMTWTAYDDAGVSLGTIMSADRANRYITATNRVGIGLAPTARLHLAAGSTTLSPLKFTSGPLLTTAEAGANEFLTDKFYGTITTGAARKEYTLNDVALNSGILPITTTNGRLTNTTVTGTEAGYLSGVTSAIQTQLNTRSIATTLTGSGDGVSTAISVTLPASSTFCMVGAANAAASGITYWTVSGTTLTINYAVAPANGTNNLSYWISYR